MLVSCCLSLLEEPLSLRRFLSVLLASATALCAPQLLSAQGAWSLRPGDPKAEVFGGYSDYHPGGKVNGVAVPNFPNGWAGQFIINTSHWTGIILDFNGHYNASASAHDFAFGLRFQRPVWHVIPFGEAMLGVQHFSPKGFQTQNTPTYIFGAGLDVKVNSKFSVRPFQLSYVNTNYTALSGSSQSNNFNGFRAQAGVLYNLGLASPEGPVTAVCTAEPSAVDSGAPVKISVTPKGFLPKRILSYSYASTGGAIAGNQSSASVDTAAVKAGTYTVTAKVTDNGKRKHQQTASCEATFSVNELHPPTLSVSADPASLKSGDAATITARGSSQDNRPLSYTCSADGGQFTGKGPTYTLDTAGVPQGKITVNCTVSDDRNLTASSSASVEVSVPAGAAAVQPSKFGVIEFKHDVKRPTRVDNEAKGELDRYADALAAAPDVKGVVVGYAAATEDKDSTSFASQRAVNTKDYLTKEKGLDPARIEPRTGSGGDQKVELWIIPAGASLAAEGTTVVDESKVKAVPRAALKTKKTHRKAHKKAHKSH